MQEYKQALTSGKTNKNAKIPYKIDCTIEVLAKSGK
jgi:hypothetical protein